MRTLQVMSRSLICVYIKETSKHLYNSIVSNFIFITKKCFKINGNEEQSLRDRQRVTLKGKIVKALAFLPTQNNKVYVPIEIKKYSYISVNFYNFSGIETLQLSV